MYYTINAKVHHRPAHVASLPDDRGWTGRARTHSHSNANTHSQTEVRAPNRHSATHVHARTTLEKLWAFSPLHTRAYKYNSNNNKNNNNNNINNNNVEKTRRYHCGDVWGVISLPSPPWPSPPLVLFSFFHFIRRFWNHIFICRSVRHSACAISIRRLRVRYRLKWNSFSSSSVWYLVYVCRPRFRSET